MLPFRDAGRERRVKTLIVNADDFGLSDGICLGVVRLLDAGAVTSTTVMACAAGAEERVRRHAASLRGRAGAHLQLTAGRPRLPPERVGSLTGTDGNFPRRLPASHAPDPDEVVAEWTAQVEALLSWGVTPTHLDGHHHVHLLPACRPALLAVARRFGLPVRAVSAADAAALRGAGIACPDVFVRDFDEGERTARRFLALAARALAACPAGGAAEIMVHPGLVEPGLEALTSYAAGRAEELAALAASGAAAAVAQGGALPGSFSVLVRDIVDNAARAKG